MGGHVGDCAGKGSSGGHKPPDGTEYAYWDQGEWATDPALVMGAIVNSAAGLTLTGIATQLGTWPARISELERGRSRNDDLETNYRAWLSQVA